MPAFDSIDGNDPPTFETEHEYLERLDLLTPSERRALIGSIT